ncbi:hypothetical protein JRO89_XS09G0036800 [Xanthoceras sorbifolium]|uniref:Uncharacterized protein n=1 Tax=Xanthoceras sorbifolium TaxID=99658 RepID=A0ABQ8HKM8_9ROSI|nr:hypothetical protein JRO89_XS09G0036800 [Xanthoceras sorbifolium]
MEFSSVSRGCNRVIRCTVDIIEECPNELKIHSQMLGIKLPCGNMLQRLTKWELVGETFHFNVTRDWNVGGDGFDSMNMENSVILEIADLSLDEPDLENALFNSTASGSIIVDE